MPRGQRKGELKKQEIIDRLVNKDPSTQIPKSWNVTRLIEEAKRHGLLTDQEISETLPRDTKTLPCYLFTYIQDAERRTKLRDYAIMTSKLFRRGSLILNLIAMETCGSRLPGGGDETVSVRRPRWSRAGAWVEGATRLAGMWEAPQGNIANNLLKHAFLPEHTSHPLVTTTMDAHPYLPPAPLGWDTLMGRTGWGQAVNRMMTKYFGNLQVGAKLVFSMAEDFVDPWMLHARCMLVLDWLRQWTATCTMCHSPTTRREPS